jgi:hypothetical protein
MANSLSYRLYLNEKLRKNLGINLKNKKIYIFKVNHITYLSMDMIPKHLEVTYVIAEPGLYNWFIDIPMEYLEYEPTGYKLLNTKGKVIRLLSGIENKKNKH